MRNSNRGVFYNVDWLLIILFVVLCLIGWINIYAATYPGEGASIFDFSKSYGKQFMFIISSLVIAVGVLAMESRLFQNLALPIYIFTMVLLAGVLIFGKEIKGAQSWYVFGGFSLQPSEFAKYGTALMVSKYLGERRKSIGELGSTLVTGLIIAIPCILILLQPDTGSTLVYASFIFVMYRKGLSGNFLILGLLSIVLFVLALLFELPDLLMAILALSMMVYVMLFSNWKALAYSLLFFIASYLALHYFHVIQPTELLAIMSLMAIGMMIYFNRHREIKDRKQRISLLAMSVVSMWFIFTVGYIFNNVLQEHQRTRITVLLGEEGKLEDQITELSARYHEMDENDADRQQLRQDIKDKKESLSNLRRGAGWNVNQSKIAIGSGGVAGKGFLQGTQTKGNFVPEQSTDFIFCTVGEEWGFLGSGLVVLLFVVLLVKLVFAAERQKTEFARVYGYSLASIIFIHFSINIAMTLGLAPVIGIPLPMFSYGGSSLWAFTLLYFTFINLDAHRTQELGQ